MRKNLYSFQSFQGTYRIYSTYYRNHWTLVILCYANHLYHYIKEGEKHFGVDYSHNTKEKVESSNDENQYFYVIIVLNEFKE